MEFETLKKDNRKKWLIGTVVVLIIASVVFFVSTRANYKDEHRLNLINTKVTWNPTDLEIVSIQIKEGDSYRDIDAVPTSGYTLSDESYCEVNGNRDTSIQLEYKDGKVYIQVGNKGTKCHLVFEESDDITILATLNNVATDTFPAKNGSYMPKSISCTGDVDAKFDLIDWQVEVDATKGTTCTVDFEAKKSETFNTYLKSKVCSSSVTNETQAKDCLVNENGYRYEGSDPNNYVLFNDELWRIIGVFDVKPSGSDTMQSLVKLIRNETLDGLAWNLSGTSVDPWNSATLQSSLNNGYLNAADETCYAYSTSVTKTCKFSESGIKSGARDKIQAVQWNVGKAQNTMNANKIYTSEISATWSGSVGLMSASDYGYATYASTGCPRSTNINSYGKTDCAGKNWLYKDGSQWTLTPDSYYTGYALYVLPYAFIGGISMTNSHGVRPSIYLKSSVKILGGLGTHELPYVIDYGLPIPGYN